MEYSFTNVWGQSWALYKKSWLMLTAGVAIYFVANIPIQALSIMQQIFKWGQEENPDQAVWWGMISSLETLAVIWFIFVVLPLAGGMHWMGVPLALTQYGVAYNLLLSQDGIAHQPSPTSA
ncbi:MAG: hypothetical protein EXS15_03100 [Phycisphaerales bacterium]|nr:hypothetical protein [Phycisphaerales bacterium]